MFILRFPSKPPVMEQIVQENVSCLNGGCTDVSLSFYTINKMYKLGMSNKNAGRSMLAKNARQET